MTQKQILNRHQQTLSGNLRAGYISSKHLGIRKPYYVYEPPNIASLQNLPTTYLFRGHQREWVNLEEDSSRATSTAIEDIDKAIALGMIPPVLLVMPGLNSSNNHIPSLGIDMVGSWSPELKGLGTGRFWRFMTKELLPAINQKYPQASGPRSAVGFSLGGFTVNLLATKLPGFFKHVGIYDGLFMWPAHCDPRIKPVAPGNDTVWMHNGLFDAVFGNPRDEAAMASWNPTDMLMNASDSILAQLKQTTWWISCAAGDGNKGNRDRSKFYRELMQKNNIPVGVGEHYFKQVVFNPKAAHTWHWADRFLIRFLQATLD